MAGKSDGEAGDNNASVRAGLWAGLVFAATAFFVIGAGAGLKALENEGRLVAPPLTATDCIDEKLALMREADLSGVTLIGVGSSATWTNFVPAEFERALPGERGFNAALCFLHVDQTLFWTDLLLDRAPSARTVVMFTAGRDFENCDPADTKIFDPTLGRLYLDRRIPGWLVHAINFRWSYVVHEWGEIKGQRDPYSETTIYSDPSGWNPLYQHTSWMPPPRFDPRCFAALRALEARVAASGARFVIAPVPTMPSWKARFDPDGAVTRGWIAAMRRELSPQAVFVDVTAGNWPESDFADPVHLLAGRAIAGSRVVARTAAPALLAGRRS